MGPVLSPIDACLLLLTGWIVVGAAGMLRPGHVPYVARVLFPLGALIGAGLAVVAGASLALPAERVTLLIGLPDLPMHMRLDPLVALVPGAAGRRLGRRVDVRGRLFPQRRGHGAGRARACSTTCSSPAWRLVLLADDAYAFMVAWETMALSSYFLVTTQHRLPEIRSAGFLYLLLAHVGRHRDPAVLRRPAGRHWQFTFDAMRAARARRRRGPASPSAWRCSASAPRPGLVPMHVWLPEAHPAAPSPVSALMSGVMLKTAVYGVLRVTFDLLGDCRLVVGAVLLALGLVHARCSAWCSRPCRPT